MAGWVEGLLFTGMVLPWLCCEAEEQPGHA